MLHDPPAGIFARMESPACWQIPLALFRCSGDCRWGHEWFKEAQGRICLAEKRVWLHLRRAVADPASGVQEGHWGRG